jgi:hypothetical protein
MIAAASAAAACCPAADSARTVCKVPFLIGPGGSALSGRVLTLSVNPVLPREPAMPVRVTVTVNPALSGLDSAPWKVTRTQSQLQADLVRGGGFFGTHF